MNVLGAKRTTRVHHFTPLQYLPFIGRTRRLRSKASLRAAGFAETHFRSTSRARDDARGFSAYVHLTLGQYPEILKSKLAAGFPHIDIAVPVKAVDCVPYDLCRYNVARTRRLRRGEILAFLSRRPTVAITSRIKFRSQEPSLTRRQC